MPAGGRSRATQTGFGADATGILDEAGDHAGGEAVGRGAPSKFGSRRLSPASSWWCTSFARCAEWGGCRVLIVSPEAAGLVRHLVASADLPDGAGVRIVIDAKHHSLSMGLARQPEPRDEVISSDGALVFLSQPATGRLDCRTLEAEVTDLRSVFYLSG